MAENLKAGELPLNKVFSSEFDYFIPSYQRPYSWTVNEAGTLFDDLYDFWKTQREQETYFLGSIVLVKQDSNPSSEVIDGQQRLTTLTILLAALSNCFKNQPGEKETLRKYLWEQGDIFMKIEPKPRLKLRERDADFFVRYILNEKFEELNILNTKALSDSQRLIKANAGVMCKYISDRLKSPGQICEFVSFILQRCYMVVVTTPNTQSAFRVFSVLNNRGLSLLPSDIIKADIIGKIERSAQNKYTEKWDDMEETLGRDGFNALLSHVRMIFAKCKSQQSVVEAFEKNVISRYPDARKLIDDVLEPYSAAYNVTVHAAYESSGNTQQINSNLSWLNKIDDADWMPAMMVALIQYENDEEFLRKFTASMERLAAAMYLTSKTLNYRIARYADILRAQEDGDGAHVLKLMQLSPEEKNHLTNVLNGDIYHLPPRKRTYVVARLDSFVSDNAFKQIDSTVLTIEHVLPQNPDAGSEWLSVWPDAEQRIQWTHKLANLIPLTRKKNSQAQNYDFQTKKEKYFTGKYGTTSYALATQILQYPTWTPDDLRKRQSRILSIFSEKWDLDYIEPPKPSKTKNKYHTDGNENKNLLKEKAAKRIEKVYDIQLHSESNARYIAGDFAVQIFFAEYKEKNRGYFYSVAPAALEWLKSFCRPYLAFILGTESNVLLFTLEQIESMLPNCGISSYKDKPGIRQYNIRFVVGPQNKIFFRHNSSEEEENITNHLIK